MYRLYRFMSYGFGGLHDEYWHWTYSQNRLTLDLAIQRTFASRAALIEIIRSVADLASRMTNRCAKNDRENIAVCVWRLIYLFSLSAFIVLYTLYAICFCLLRLVFTYICFRFRLHSFSPQECQEDWLSIDLDAVDGSHKRCSASMLTQIGFMLYANARWLSKSSFISIAIRTIIVSSNSIHLSISAVFVCTPLRVGLPHAGL